MTPDELKSVLESFLVNKELDGLGRAGLMRLADMPRIEDAARAARRA
jgi:hypothetical protein